MSRAGFTSQPKTYKPDKEKCQELGPVCGGRGWSGVGALRRSAQSCFHSRPETLPSLSERRIAEVEAGWCPERSGGGRGPTCRAF